MAAESDPSWDQGKDLGSGVIGIRGLRRHVCRYGVGESLWMRWRPQDRRVAVIGSGVMGWRIGSGPRSSRLQRTLVGYIPGHAPRRGRIRRRAQARVSNSLMPQISKDKGSIQGRDKSKEHDGGTTDTAFSTVDFESYMRALFGNYKILYGDCAGLQQCVVGY